MSDMERVGSSAMKSLAAYADSDEEEEFAKERVGEYSSGDDSIVQKADSAKRLRTMSNADIEKSQLPEAPDSAGEEEHGVKMGPRSGPRWTVDDDDDKISAEVRRIRGDSDEYEYRSDDSRLVEPPPPARPKLLHSPSPTSSRGSTPLVGKARQKPMPRLPSSQALVSYEGPEDEDEFHHRRSLEAAEEERKKTAENEMNEATVAAAAGQPRPPSDRSQKSIKSEATDDIDVDELLEKPLEAGITLAQTGNADVRCDVAVLENIQIPPPPAEKCSEELQAKFQQYVDRKRKEGYNFNEHIQARTDFRNPSIYEKLIEHFGIDEIGTNFPRSTYDPHGFKPCDYYDEIAKAQRLLMEKGAEKDVKQKSVALGATVEEKKRKTKWDN